MVLGPFLVELETYYAEAGNTAVRVGKVGSPPAVLSSVSGAA